MSSLNKEACAALLSNPDAFALALAIIAETELGLDALYGSPEVEAWDPLTVYSELESRFSVQLPTSVENRLQAAITLRTTAAFEESVSGFVAITLALTEGQLGDMVSGGLETPDLDECIWASFEAAAIDPQLGAMSQEVAVFLSDLQNSEVMDPEEQVEDSDDFPKQLDDLLQQLFAIGLPAEQIEEIVQRGLLAISDEQNQISG